MLSPPRQLSARQETPIRKAADREITTFYDHNSAALQEYSNRVYTGVPVSEHPIRTAMVGPWLALGALLLSVLTAPCRSCVWLMGEGEDAAVGEGGGTPWNYGFRGEDWVGVDANGRPWTCLTGRRQSPINLASTNTLKGLPIFRTTWQYSPMRSNGTNIQVYNNGNTIQVQWAPGVLRSSVEAYAQNNITDLVSGTSLNVRRLRRVQLTPLQFHFHSTSEHLVDGAYSPLEMHIVHVVPRSVLPGCPASGCLSVTGALINISPNLRDGNKAFDVILGNLPARMGEMESLPAGSVIDIEALLPPRTKRAYMQYEGSLTTPPCTEGLLWHVLKTPITISLKQYMQYGRAVGLKSCNKTSNGTEARRSLRMHEDHEHASHHSGGLHQHHHVHSYGELMSSLAGFKQGSYSGFVDGAALRQARAQRRLMVPQGRSLQQEGEGDSEGSGAEDRYTDCRVAAYGWTSRQSQFTNGRRVVLYG